MDTLEGLKKLLDEATKGPWRTDSKPNYQVNAELIVSAVNALPGLIACAEACQGIESTYVFLDSLTSGIEPQHTNTVNALAKVRAALAKLDKEQA